MTIPCKKIAVFGVLSLFTLLGILAARPPENEKPAYKNLRVLSKNISDDDMDFVMENFNAGLGVNCLFCHSSKKEGINLNIDYASDESRNKRTARDMLRMLIKLDRKYFYTPKEKAIATRGVITCKTCHRGSPVPIFTKTKSN